MLVTKMFLFKPVHLINLVQVEIREGFVSLQD